MTFEETGSMTLEKEVSQLEKFYRSQLRYFERPISANFGYDYDLVTVANPSEFVVRIKDDITTEYLDRLQALLKAYEDGALADDGKARSVEPEDLYLGMPVLVRVGGDGVASSLKRAEVLQFQGREVNVLLVDQGGTLQKVEVETLFEVTVDMLRIPKLGFICRLSQVAPAGGISWLENVDYAKDFVGTTSQKVTFMDYYPKTKSYDVVVEIDQINLSLKYFLTYKGQPAALDTYPGTGAGNVGFPVNDFTGWLGLKVTAFGTKVFYEEGRLKCSLQLQPDMVNDIQDWIAEYIAKRKKEDVDNVKPFNKQPGTICLARYGGGDEYFRSKILKCLNADKYLVDFVDYKDTATVAASDLLKYPEDLIIYPEGATVCQITDFINSDCKDVEKLRSIVVNKDLYAVVDACDRDFLEFELIVSLFEPADALSGADKSVGEIFNIADRPPMVKECLQTMEPVTEQLEAVFLKPRLPILNNRYPGVRISSVESLDSIWIQLAEEIELSARISTEMTQFYENGACDEESQMEFLKGIKVGMCVAARQNDDPENIWYRAKILEIEGNKLLLHYIDFGNTSGEFVENIEVYPLHAYFVKDHIMAFEVGLK